MCFLTNPLDDAHAHGETSRLLPSVASRFFFLFILLFVLGAGHSPAQLAPATASSGISSAPAAPLRAYPRSVESVAEAQIALARIGISSGPIDGVAGPQTAAALRAFQQSRALPVTGRLDDATRAALTLDVPPLSTFLVTAADLAGLQPTGKSWLEKSQQSALAHETALELVAERTHANPKFIKRLNPSINWDAPSPVSADTRLIVPHVVLAPFPAKAAHIEIRLADRTLQARDIHGNLLVHFPVSIARKAEKRPLGDLRVTVVIPNPNYTFDPANFPESPEALVDPTRKLILAPGPNNPVGVAWIGIDRPGYGIHGTHTPEQVGRTESIGCFRLANWDARTLLSLAWVGLPVTVLP